MFIHYKGTVLNTDLITKIDVSDYVRRGVISVYRNDKSIYEPDYVSGAEATNVIMTLCPAVLEGKRAKYARHAWAIHNLIGHPLMQLCAWLHLTPLGIKIHDATVPEPKQED